MIYVDILNIDCNRKDLITHQKLTLENLFWM
jgi:hypothetical protein